MSARQGKAGTSTGLLMPDGEGIRIGEQDEAEGSERMAQGRWRD